jgi:dTDP-glucose 4,6-dehydratase
MELGASAGAFRRVVVLGGAGFVGSHLCDRLLRDGSAVVCVDDHSGGKATNVGHLPDVDRFGTRDPCARAGLHVVGAGWEVSAVTPLFGEPAEVGRRTA